MTPPRARAARLGPPLLLALVVAGGLLAGCGRKGPPVPPERRLPAAVQDLTAAVAGEGVRLGWTLPRVRVDRSPLRDLRRVEVYRRPETGEKEPPRPAILTFRGLFGGPPEMPGFERIANIALVEPAAEGQAAPEAPPRVPSGPVSYLDSSGLTYGRQYTYVVVAVDEQGRPSPPSNRVTVDMLAPPRPPGRPTVQAGDGQVRLAWTPPDALEDGSPPGERLVYDVFRTTAAGAPPGRPVNPEPLAEPRFTDVTVQNDATYYYSVRALRGPGGPASRPTEVVSATPEDTTAPGQPRGLVAVAAGPAVRLAWEAVPDPDLAGYHVYRSTTTGRGHTRITPAPQGATTFVDAEARPGQTYYYQVTAVDRSRRANESVPSAEVSATVGR
jgi:hypothetical protein